MNNEDFVVESLMNNLYSMRDKKTPIQKESENNELDRIASNLTTSTPH
jgi:hypothetical protein